MDTARLKAILSGLLPWNQGNRKTQILVGVAILLLIGALASLARAESYAQISAGSAILRGETSAVDLALVYPDAGPGDASVVVGAVLLGTSTLYKPQPSQFAWHADVVDGFGRFDIGIGFAYLQNVDVYNGSHTNFTLSAAYRLRRWPITFTYRHFSNAGTVAPNKGRDVLLVGWRMGAK